MMRRVALSALIAVVVVVVAWYGVFWRSERAHLAAARAQEQQAAQQVLADRATVFGLQVQHKKLAQDEAVLDKLLKGLPNGPSLDQLLDTLNNAATEANVQLGAISTPTPAGWVSAQASSSPASTTPGPQSVSVNLAVNGTENDVLKFITDLDDQSRIYVVHSFAFSANEGALLPNSQQSASLSVDVFYQSASSGNPTFPG
jgi:Tfp pilus assembly protein PilO